MVESIKVAVDRLTHSTNFLNFSGQHAFIMQDENNSADSKEGTGDMAAEFSDSIFSGSYHF